MKVPNFGLVKNALIISLQDELINENSIDRNKKVIKSFLDTVSESHILKAQNQIYTNLEKAYIPDSDKATKYIDMNITMLESISYDDIINENNKLLVFINESINKSIASSNDLYQNIEILIYESTKILPQVDKLHEAFYNIHEYIMNNKKNSITDQIQTNEDFESTDEIIEHSINLYNKKYESLNESERVLVSILSENDTDKVNVYFENLKKDTLTKLLDKENNTLSEGLNKTINETIEKTRNLEVSDENIIKLYDLNKSLS